MITLKRGGRATASRRAGLSKFKQKRAMPAAKQRKCQPLHDWVSQNRPALPVSVLWPEKVEANARNFARGFKGKVMYAVKCNPDPEAIKAVYRGGVRRFDVASLHEIALVSDLLPDVTLYFMHPVKAPEAIRKAYSKYGVRKFVLDSEEELLKIMRMTDCATDLDLFVRIALPKHDGAGVALHGKFGALPDEAISLLQKARAVSRKLGVSFHVGSQCMEPELYAQAIRLTADIIDRAGIKVDVLDVGGGFPSHYPDMTPPADHVYFSTIHRAIAECGLKGLELISEPGRRLVVDAGAIVARVEGRKNDLLYLNDGVYGGLYDAGPSVRFRFPVALLRSRLRGMKSQAVFRFAGPTCDSHDMMEGPFSLPDDVAEGDWIVFERMGGYSDTFRTNFNGFAEYLKIYL
ncbi:MAG: type III PLP-dependent enzyme [Alphaproteobacteria bacterium]|nr:type III PLP-dependent enzyme [Alphaproteobacteria bacterium]